MTGIKCQTDKSMINELMSDFSHIVQSRFQCYQYEYINVKFSVVLVFVSSNRLIIQTISEYLLFTH